MIIYYFAENFSMRIKLYAVLGVLIILPTIMIQANSIEKVINLLNQQVVDWNEGNLEAFMQGYVKSDELQFIGSKGVTYGWDKTLANYKKSYPDKATMGQLSFELIEVVKQSAKIFSVTGKFKLVRKDMDNAEGHFLLIVKKIKGHWLIIADHTS